MKAVAQAINNFSADDIKKFEQNKTFDIEINQEIITLELTDVEISSKDIEGWLVASSAGLTVALDITLTDELKDEGVARELVNRIQNLRKDSGLELTDRILVTFQANELIINSVNNNINYIKAETLADSVIFEENVSEGVDIEFDGINTKLFLKKN